MTVKKSIRAATSVVHIEAAHIADSTLIRVRNDTEIATYRAVDTATFIAVSDIADIYSNINNSNLDNPGASDATRDAVDAATWHAFNRGKI